MSKSLRILLVSPEVVPFAKTGGLADVSGALPKKLKNMGHDIRILLPKYRMIRDRKHSLREVKRLAAIPLEYAGTDEPFALRSAALLPERVQVYLMEHKGFFDRDGLYVDPSTNTDYEDNAERFAFFCRGLFTGLETLHWAPDILFCNDWQTALIPYWLKSHFVKNPFFAKTKTVLAIHNLAFQGIFPLDKAEILELEPKEYAPHGPLEFWGKLNFLKAGIETADKIVTVSPNYAKEIQTTEVGCGLEGVLKQRKKDLIGILNGIDTDVWNPETDTDIPAQYSTTNLTGKTRCKQMLQVELNLQHDVAVPMFGLVSRLTEQKGIDVVIETIPTLINTGAHVVILGVGEQRFADQLTELQKVYPDKLSVNLTFDDPLAHRIEAAADFFLMPSRYEPSGLNQMYSLRYGTIPIVTKVGGLADSVEELNEKTKKGNGIIVKDVNTTTLLKACKRALTIYQQPQLLNAFRVNAMSVDHSWELSAKKYEAIFLELADSIQ
ncbi:MAG: glycogen synthase GlgA [bacterium]|nr:glycogen synthase GlgA [bacterium]